jgi:hypothetical protein
MDAGKHRKGYLYTWNLFDGDVGQPCRKIQLSGLDHRLLKKAFLAGGPGWDDKTPEKGLLCLVLQASTHRQSLSAYEACFEHYRLEHLESIGVCEDLSGFDRAMWMIEIPVADCSDSEIDDKVVQVLRWHIGEIERILK